MAPLPLRSCSKTTPPFLSPDAIEEHPEHIAVFAIREDYLVR